MYVCIHSYICLYIYTLVTYIPAEWIVLDYWQLLPLSSARLHVSHGTLRMYVQYVRYVCMYVCIYVCMYKRYAQYIQYVSIVQLHLVPSTHDLVHSTWTKCLIPSTKYTKYIHYDVKGLCFDPSCYS